MNNEKTNIYFINIIIYLNYDTDSMPCWKSVLIVKILSIEEYSNMPLANFSEFSDDVCCWLMKFLRRVINNLGLSVILLFVVLVSYGSH